MCVKCFRFWLWFSNWNGCLWAPTWSRRRRKGASHSMRGNPVFWRRRSCCHFHDDALDTSERCRPLLLCLSWNAFDWRGWTQSPEELIIDDLPDGLTASRVAGRRMNRASKRILRRGPSSLLRVLAYISAPPSATSYISHPLVAPRFFRFSVKVRCYRKAEGKLKGKMLCSTPIDSNSEYHHHPIIL